MPSMSWRLYGVGVWKIKSYIASIDVYNESTIVELMC